jgi:peptidoglycan/xylan/chitin deacetylase (PgdA/CDA1 family)
MKPRFKPLVLCFHAVSETWDHELAVTPQMFERILRGLTRRGYRAVSAAELSSDGKKLLHVTFDDAFRSIAYVVPVLEQLGVPATVFVSTAFAETGAALRVSELADEHQKNENELLTMDWTALRDLAKRGIEIGSHTVNHPHLPELSASEIATELTVSRERIEDELGRPCRFLAYPYGECDERSRVAARSAGYDAAFTLHGRARPADVFALPRVDIYRRDSWTRAMAKTTRFRELAWTALDVFDRSRSSAWRTH